MFTKMSEEEVKDKYPEASLHEIDTNRICLSPVQLEMIFYFKLVFFIGPLNPYFPQNF